MADPWVPSLNHAQIESNGHSQPDMDVPPSFPLAGGPQVAAASSCATPASTRSPSVGFSVSGAGVTRNNPSSSLMPPPTSSGPSLSVPRSLGSPDFSGPSKSSGSSLMPPPRTTAAAPLRLAPASSSSSGGLLAPSAPKIKRNKVALAPGFGPLDWARLKSSGKPELRAGLSHLQRITPEELKKHNKPDDAWSAFQGKVYNLTPYLRYHPGGVDELMRVAGRDGTRLFMLTHSWVNIEAMIDTTMVGFLVPN